MGRLGWQYRNFHYGNMLTQQAIQIRAAHARDYGLIAEHFYQMWLDNHVPVSAIAPNWRETVLEFIDRAQRELNYQAFVAEVDHQVVGSASCQKFAGLYPQILVPTYRCDGYLWGVYVHPAYRRQGIATQLTQHAIDYLKAIGCKQALLNASPWGQPVYTQLGFTAGNVMRLELRS